MRILLDTCVWGGVSSTLKAAGYNVVWVEEWETNPDNESILVIVYRETRTHFLEESSS